jgi:hypothetical protein
MIYFVFISFTTGPGPLPHTVYREHFSGILGDKPLGGSTSI